MKLNIPTGTFAIHQHKMPVEIFNFDRGFNFNTCIYKSILLIMNCLGTSLSLKNLSKSCIVFLWITYKMWITTIIYSLDAEYYRCYLNQDCAVFLSNIVIKRLGQEDRIIFRTSKNSLRTILCAKMWSDFLFCSSVNLIII